MNLKDIQALYDFTGKTVVITGGSSVLGSAMVAGFAGLGANVAVLSRSGTLPPETSDPLKNAPGEIITLQADVLQKEALLEAE